MNKALLNTGVQEYIKNNLHADILSVVLKKSPFDQISGKELARQIEARNSCRKKLPSWYGGEGIYYPKLLHIEQASSEATARYKSELVSGRLLDATGGFGADTFYFSQKASSVTYCEIDPELFEITRHNFNSLGAGHIDCRREDGIAFAQKEGQFFDFIYADPSRRTGNQRVFGLSDCEPDILLHLAGLLRHSDHLLLKTSPMLDISAGLNALANVCELHIVALGNEVKELLWLLKKDHLSEPVLRAVNLKKASRETFVFLRSEEALAVPEFSRPGRYLYEPNSAIMKSGAFKLAGLRYGLKKLHEHSHLYTSDQLVPFPGRRFLVGKVIPYSGKRTGLRGIVQANISVRNFPSSVKQLRTMHDIGDGGSSYLFFTTGPKNDLLIIAGEKV